MQKRRAFLKWAGGKYTLAEAITERLPQGAVLLEPFVGAGSIFLNSDYERYVLNDINADLIALYNHLKVDPDRLIAEARRWFTPEYNDKSAYIELRETFNQSRDTFLRAQLFLYFNRHGYNGLCRYNKKGIFNVPFGSYKKPYFPEEELWFFAEKSQRATFTCLNYAESMAQAQSDWIIYCDPPYVPLSHSANFTAYSAPGFTLDDQALLGKMARQCAERGIPVLLSNHDTPLTRELYHGAVQDEVQVRRSISRNGSNRVAVPELLAFYPAAELPVSIPLFTLPTTVEV